MRLWPGAKATVVRTLVGVPHVAASFQCFALSFGATRVLYSDWPFGHSGPTHTCGLDIPCRRIAAKLTVVGAFVSLHRLGLGTPVLSTPARGALQRGSFPLVVAWLAAVGWHFAS